MLMVNIVHAPQKTNFPIVLIMRALNLLLNFLSVKIQLGTKTKWNNSLFSRDMYQNQFKVLRIGLLNFKFCVVCETDKQEEVAKTGLDNLQNNCCPLKNTSHG